MIIFIIVIVIIIGYPIKIYIVMKIIKRK